MLFVLIILILPSMLPRFGHFDASQDHPQCQNYLPLSSVFGPVAKRNAQREQVSYVGRGGVFTAPF